MEEISVKLDEVPTLRVSLDNIVVKNVEAIKSHARLKDRDLSDQHPISAITGLEDALRTVVSEDKISEAVNTALAQAKASGEFNGDDGEDGKTPVKGVDYYTEADKSEFSEYIASELAKRGQLKPEFAQSEEWLDANGDQSKMYVLPDGFIYAWMLTEKEVEGGPAYTNRLPLATDTDRETIYGGDYNGDGVNDGYIQGQRLSSSGGTAVLAIACASGFIPAKPGDVLRIKGISPINGSASSYIITYDSANTKKTHKEIPRKT